MTFASPEATMHQPYVRLPKAYRALREQKPIPPPRLGRAPWRARSIPLTVLAELLNCDSSSPYRAVNQFGLAVWVKSRVREQLTRGAHYAFGLELERAVKFNAAEMERHGLFVLDLRTAHQSRPLDGLQLAVALEMPPWKAAADFRTTWKTFVNGVADELIAASREGHLEDLPWDKAERYLDAVVAPRVRAIKRVDPHAETPLPNGFGGVARFRRVTAGLASPDPEVVEQTLQGYECERLFSPDAPDPSGWQDWDEV